MASVLIQAVYSNQEETMGPQLALAYVRHHVLEQGCL